MGYVAAFKKHAHDTPAAIVITETVVDILFIHTADDSASLLQLMFLLICGKKNKMYNSNRIVWSSWHI